MAAGKNRPLRPGEENRQAVALDLKLTDAYGREVRTGDFGNLPLLILVGACW